MGQAAKKYGESPKDREQNGRKLKEVRQNLGLTAKRASELLKLNNVSSVVNCETACSSEMFNSRMKQYSGLENPHSMHSAKKNVEQKRLQRSIGAVFEDLEIGKSLDDEDAITSLSKFPANHRLDMRTKVMLEIAVRRLAKAEKISEVDIWLNLMDLTTQAESR